MEIGEMFHYGKFGETKNFKKAMAFYQEAESKATTYEQKGSCFMSMAELHEEHLNIPKAIEMYLLAFEHGHDQAIMHVASIYSHGAHPIYLPSKFIASQLYNEIQVKIPSLKEQCDIVMKDMYTYNPDEILQENRIYNTLSNNIIHRMHHHLLERKLKFPTPQPDTPTVRNVFVVLEPERLPRQRIRNDAQNVHDPLILNTMVKNMKNIDATSTFQRAVDDFKSQTDATESTNRVIESLNDVTHSKFDQSEQNIFAMVWDRINHPDNADKKEDLLKILKQNIESAIEYDKVVCSTGKITRMLSTLEVLDDKMEIARPEWTFKQEIGEKLGHMVKSKLDNATSEVQNAYNSLEPTVEEEEISTRFKEEISEQLRNECYKEYDGVLENDRLDMYMNEQLKFI
jgi:tetratricopeptide (TPR) repeat protein